jgi:hypothetical protein
MEKPHEKKPILVPISKGKVLYVWENDVLELFSSELRRVVQRFKV